MKITIKQAKELLHDKNKSLQWKAKAYYRLFSMPENFETFCRFCLPKAFTKPFGKFHKEIINEFMLPKDSAVAAPRGHGKNLEDSTPVLTSKGFKTHGELKTGDYVFSPSGKQIKILSTSKKYSIDYEVTTRDGEIIQCHGNHEWTVHDRNIKRLKYKTLETKDMIGEWSNKGERSRYQLPLRKALRFDYKELPLDPYYVGLWLGDGTSTNTSITYDKNDVATINNIPYKQINTDVHKDSGVYKTSFTHQGIQENLRKLNLYKNKHIPRIYLEGSKEQRLKLLAGLIDSDGHVCKKRGRVRFININKQLIDDVEELVLGLGMRPYVTNQEPHSHKHKGRWIHGRSICYTVNFNPIEYIPTMLKRKQIKRIPDRHMLGIVSVKYTPGVGKGKCIQVDSKDGLYLVGKRLIPTHNSTLIGQGFVIWNILYNKYKYIIYTSQNHSKSVQFLEPIAKEFKFNTMIKYIYGNLRLDTVKDEEADNRDREDIFDINNVRVQALSFEKNIRGMKYGNQRPDLIILDDIEDDQRVINPDLRHKDKNKLNKEIIPAVDAERGVIKFVGTILHHDSLLVQSLRTFDGKIYRACEFEGEKIIDSSILFPDLFTAERLMAIKKKIGSTPFQSEYLNNPVDDVASLIKRAWVINCFDDKLSFDFASDSKYDFRYQGVDFAFSDRVSADKSAFVGIGVANDEYTLICCLTRKGMSITEQFDYIEYLSGIYGYDDNALEENSIRSMSKELINYNFKSTLYWTGASDKAHTKKRDVDFAQKRYTVGKTAMINRLATQFENKRIRIPYKTDKDKEVANRIMDECCTYALNDGKLVEVGVHGDIPIALGYAIERAESDRFEYVGGML